MQLSRGSRGFTFTELAVVFAIVALLIGGAMATLSAQVDQRNLDETQRRLDAAVEALLGFAIVNRRLPCPATPGTTGNEDPVGGGTCTTYLGGFLPAVTLGLQPTDAQGYAIDAWSNRIRYVVANAGTGCTTAAPFFTSAANLKTNGVSCRPNDLDVCATSTGTTPTSCNTATRIVSTQTVVLIVYSTGKNGSIASAYGADETENTDGDLVFVSRPPGTVETTTGAYDDVMVWVPVGGLYGRLIAAGVLP